MKKDEWPAVTCLCPTYGRFSLLREALACFLAQDYPGEKKLLILNDAPTPIFPDDWQGMAPCPKGGEVLNTDYSVQVWNQDNPYRNLGEKRAALLWGASTPLVAHWDDDDLYLPWHLTRCVEAKRRRRVGCVKSRGAFYMVGNQVRGIRHNVFEGSMLFHREEAVKLGGYPPLHSGQAKALLDAFDYAGRLRKIPDDEGFISYVYRWGQGVGHISAIGNQEGSAARFDAANQDFGEGEHLAPADLTPHWQALLRTMRFALSKERYAAFESALLGAPPAVPEESRA